MKQSKTPNKRLMAPYEDSAGVKLGYWALGRPLHLMPSLFSCKREAGPTSKITIIKTSVWCTVRAEPQQDLSQRPAADPNNERKSCREEAN